MEIINYAVTVALILLGLAIWVFPVATWRERWSGWPCSDLGDLIIDIGATAALVALVLLADAWIAHGIINVLWGE